MNKIKIETNAFDAFEEAVEKLRIGGNFWLNSTSTNKPSYPSEDKEDESIPPHIESMTFEFSQESNCVDGGGIETLTVEAKSSLGIHEDGGAFYVLKTEQWSVDGVEDMEKLLSRVDAAVKAAMGSKR